MNLLSNIKIWQKSGSGSTGNAATGAAISSTFIDMSNWDGCLFLVIAGTTVLASSGVITVQQCTGTSTGGGWASTFTNKLILGSSHRILAVDVVKPLRRYLRLKTLTCTGMIVVPITYSGRARGSTELLNIVRATSNQPSGVHICTS